MSTWPVSVVEGQGRLPHTGSESTSSKSPLANFTFYKSLTGEKKTTRDGQPPKRRGPKPDSKPALTRRQELNRQAQRTHRERKEMYTKALEQEVIRLKDAFGEAERERDTVAAENRELKEILMAHGIAVTGSGPKASDSSAICSSARGESSTMNGSRSYPPGSSSTGCSSPPNLLSRTIPPTSSNNPPPKLHHMRQASNDLQYDQIGTDFVLTLERPCMKHMPFLMARANDSEPELYGHALMATHLAESHLTALPPAPSPQRPPLAKPNLLKLLDLSNRLPLDGEITPVMAWALLSRNARFPELTVTDIDAIRQDLLAKIRCYGFGAVLEEFEVRDSLMAVIAGK